MLDDLNLDAIQDSRARELIQRLLNLIEELSESLGAAQAEIQRLRDELNRLKGEQGKPQLRPQAQAGASKHSSEQERRQPRERRKGSKKALLAVDREQVLTVDRAMLPEDACFKGYQEVVVQDLCLRPDNIRFRREKYYAASTGKTYLASLPPGYQGQFGPGIKTLVLLQYYGVGSSEPKIVEFLRELGVQISDGEVSRLLTQGQEAFHAEKAAAYETGLRSSPWQQVDDTLTRVNGVNHSCHVVCNPFYSAYFTQPTKERLAVLDVLRNRRPRCFCLNAEALRLLENMPLGAKTRQRLQTHQSERVRDEAAFSAHLDVILPKLSTQQRRWIVGAAAIAAYHADRTFPVIRTLVCDDAPQFNWLTESMMLCWVHEGRPYKKLTPFVAQHRELRDAFLTQFWDYYRQLLAYRRQPTPQERARLEAAFETLFATRTGYGQLDRQIAKTQAKKAALLLVLQHPELPLHNNAAELAVRQRVRKRDISFGPRTPAGTQAWDTFMTLAETTKKLGVSFYAYLRDRIYRTCQIPPLATLIANAADDLNLGQSWVPT